MRSIDYLLIGGGLASVKAALQIREHDRRGTVLIVGEEPAFPYDRPPLSKEIIRRELSVKAIRCEPRLSYLKHRIGVWRGSRVTRLQLDAAPGTRHPHRAELESGRRVRFAKALLATGGVPRKLEAVPGASLANVFALRSATDAQKIAAHARDGARAVVIGGGFIGVELAASLTQRGCAVTLVEQQDRLWPAFAPKELSDFLSDYLSARAVDVRCGDSVAAFHGSTALSSVQLRSGKQLQADFACVACGIVPRLELAEEAGLDVDDGLVVDEHLRSSHPDIFGAGDIARFHDPHFDISRRVEHYGQAEYTGLLAGANMSGEHRSYELLTYVWSDLFDLHIEAAGNESDYDRLIVRGSLEEKKALLLLLRNSRLMGYLGINASEADFGPMQLLIKRGTDLSGSLETLSDPTKPLAPLLQSS